jgi:spore coat polysaccharide biosynthesis protein SpsF
MKYYCFVQARYSSKRLRGKVLKKFGKLTLLEILIKRLNKSKKIDEIIVLTSKSIEDKKIINLCKKKKIKYFSGSLQNVFSRFQQAIKKFRPKKIIRICADSPLIDWRIIDKMIDISNNNGFYDVISNVKIRTFPKGQSVEILNPKIFNLKNNILSKDQKEHVTKYFYLNKKYKIKNIKNKIKYSKLNLSIDDYSDYIKISRLIKKLGMYKPWSKYVKEI